MATTQNNTMYGVSIQCKYKNASQWQESDVLLAGEIGIELDTGKGKVGDGVKTWAQLDYSVDPTVNGVITALTSRVGTNEGNISTLTGDVTQAKTDITNLQSADTTHETRMTTIEAKDTAQDGRLDALESKDTTHESRMTTIESKDTEQDGRIAALEGITVISANPAPAANG